MGLMEDMLTALDRWDEWRVIRSLPKRVADLEAQVEDLNRKLNGKWPPDVCKYCGERAVRMTSTIGPNTKGLMQEMWLCSSCNGHEQRQVKPS